MKIKIYRTMHNTKERLSHVGDFNLQQTTNLDKRCIVVDSSKKYQTHLGFGGALTRATQLNLNKLTQEQKQEFYEAYYGESGHKFNMIRLTINSTDFGDEVYDYLPDGSEDLSEFSLEREKDAIHYYKKIKKEAGKDLFTMATPWSPPAYMKDNKEMRFGGKILESYYEDWAKYVSLYIQEMAKADVKVDVISIQNEPEASQTWESTAITAQEEAELVKQFAAAFKAAELDTKIMIWDHNKDEMVRRANVTLQDEKVNDLVWGVAYHWYVSENFANISLTHHLHPDKHILMTEACVELNNAQSTTQFSAMSTWENGEHYGKNIIHGLNNYTEGWIDWNLLLDEKGGPTYVDNFCESPIMYDNESKSLIYNYSYYFIGHFSRFIEVGARRIFSQNDFERGVINVAYENPNGDIVLVVQNENHNEQFVLIVNGQPFTLTLPSRSISTYIIKGGSLS